MANVSRPQGLRPERYWNAALWQGQAQLYWFSASQANDCYIYDMVQFDTANRSNGTTDNYVPGIPAIKPVVAALTTSTYRGVVVGFIVQPDFSMSVTASLGLKYRQASTARYAWVVDDINVIFQVEENGASAAANALNKTVDIAYVAGSTTTGLSKVRLDTTSFQTAAVRPLRAVKYSYNIDNDLTSANPRWDVLMANSDLAQANFGA
jgi:hypothetical protein